MVRERCNVLVVADVRRRTAFYKGREKTKMTRRDEHLSLSGSILSQIVEWYFYVVIKLCPMIITIIVSFFFF